MAESTAPEPKALNQEAGLAFRLEMATQRLVLSYWKHLVAGIVVVVVSFGLYGWTKERNLARQRGYASQIATVEQDAYRALVGRLPEELRDDVRQGAPTLAAYLITAQFDPRLAMADIDRATLGDAAASLRRIGDDARGAARAEAFLKAAELYRLAGDATGQRHALASAASAAGDGVLYFVAETSLANTEIDAGDVDAGLARLRALSERDAGILAQRAALDLGQALEGLGRSGEAREVYEAFLERWAQAPGADEAERRLAGLREGA